MKEFFKEWIKFFVSLFIISGSTLGMVSYYILWEFRHTVKEDIIMVEKKKIGYDTEGNTGTERLDSLYKVYREVQYKKGWSED